MTWTWDESHFPVPISGAMADLYCAAAERGFASGAARYGLALTGWEVRTEDGWVFVRGLPTIRADQVRAREDTAQESLRLRRWLLDAQLWRTERVAALHTVGAHADRDLAALSDLELADHLDSVAGLARVGVARHFELHLADMIPLGRLLLAAIERGIASEEVLERCAGLSPWSRLTAEVPTSVVLGRLDVDAPQIADVVALAQHETSRRIHSAPEPWGEPVLDVLLEDVVSTFWLRDDNATLLLAAPVGLVGVALREAARRLDLPPLVLMEAATAEVAALLRAHHRLIPDDLALRASQREDASARPLAAPSELEAVADAASGGPTSRALTDALLACDALFEQDSVCGVGAGAVRGRAVVAATADGALEALGVDSVLVVRTTSPAFDPAIALARALVCESGGPLSHAALAARELGIPAVIGLRGATASIPHGAWVEVDPVAGTVTVLDAEPLDA